MSDPYFQRLFAQRIGGAAYGKGTDIYKFEKIKRAKRQALADHPERSLIDFGIGENDAMAPESVRRVMAGRSASREPRLRRQRHRLQAGGRPLHATAVWRRARSRRRGESLHRLEDGAGHAAGGVH
jgi:hypothetical protein